MAMVSVDSGSLYRRTHSLRSSGLVFGRRPLGAVLHSSNEPGKLSEWFCHSEHHKHCLEYYYDDYYYLSTICW